MTGLEGVKGVGQIGLVGGWMDGLAEGGGCWKVGMVEGFTI